MGVLGIAYHHPRLLDMDNEFQRRIAALDRYERTPPLLRPVEPRLHSHGYECGCQACRNCEAAPIGGAPEPGDVYAAHDAAFGFEGEPDACAFQPTETWPEFVQRSRLEAQRYMRRVARVLWWVLLVGSVGVSVVCWVLR